MKANNRDLNASTLTQGAFHARHVEPKPHPLGSEDTAQDAGYQHLICLTATNETPRFMQSTFKNDTEKYNQDI